MRRRGRSPRRRPAEGRTGPRRDRARRPHGPRRATIRPPPPGARSARGPAGVRPAPPAGRRAGSGDRRGGPRRGRRRHPRPTARRRRPGRRPAPRSGPPPRRAPPTSGSHCPAPGRPVGLPGRGGSRRAGRGRWSQRSPRQYRRSPAVTDPAARTNGRAHASDRPIGPTTRIAGPDSRLNADPRPSGGVACVMGTLTGSGQHRRRTGARGGRTQAGAGPGGRRGTGTGERARDRRVAARHRRPGGRRRAEPRERRARAVRGRPRRRRRGRGAGARGPPPLPPVDRRLARSTPGPVRRPCSGRPARGRRPHGGLVVEPHRLGLAVGGGGHGSGRRWATTTPRPPHRHDATWP